MAATAEDVMGGVDILIANAGGLPGNFASTSLDAREALQLNPCDCCDVLALVPAMQQRNVS